MLTLMYSNTLSILQTYECLSLLMQPSIAILIDNSSGNEQRKIWRKTMNVCTSKFKIFGVQWKRSSKETRFKQISSCLVNPLSVPEIRILDLPSNFVMPTLDIYTRMTDPRVHIKNISADHAGVRSIRRSYMQNFFAHSREGQQAYGFALYLIIASDPFVT